MEAIAVAPPYFTNLPESQHVDGTTIGEASVTYPLLTREEEVADLRLSINCFSSFPAEETTAEGVMRDEAPVS